MLLQRLVEYAERRAQDPDADALPAGYQAVPIRWLIYLDAEGRVSRPAARTTDEGGANENAKRFVAPSLVRTVGIKAKLLADNGEYTLGIARDPEDAKVPKRHRAYREVVRACAEATELTEVRAVQRFLDAPDVAALGLPEDFSPAENLTFVVDGNLLIDHPQVRSYWGELKIRARPKKAGAGKGAAEGESLISGERGVLMDREPVKIKGIPGGQSSGTNVISANESVYESYGLSASRVAPVLRHEAEAYANALNELLQDRRTHLRMGNSLVYVFWTREGEVPPVGPLLARPQEVQDDFAALMAGEASTLPVELADRPEQVRRSLASLWSGNASADARENAFYATGLSASGSRVAVRDHLELSLGQLRENLRAWFEAQAMTDDGKPGAPLGLFALAYSLYRDPKDLVPNVPVALTAFALKRSPLPFAFIDQLVKRNRAERRVTRPRAALTKMVLASNKEDMTGMETLVRDRPEAAYHLGRLLAALDSLQFAALGSVGASVVDRFYGSFSTAPASVLGRLMQSAQSHLGKIRKTRPGVHTNLQKRLQEILANIDDVPDTLTTKEQALFSVGFYHERADYWAAVHERMEQREQQDDQQNDQPPVPEEQA